MKLARKIQQRKHPSRQANQTKAEESGETKDDKEGENEEAAPGPAPTEQQDMRRLPPQGKEKCGSPRVTLRIHQFKEKKEKGKNGATPEPNGDGMEGVKTEEPAPGKEPVPTEESQSRTVSPVVAKETEEPAVVAPAAETPETVKAPDVPAAAVKRSHSTEDDGPGEEGKKRRKKEEKGKSGSSTGGSPKSLIGVESEGEDAKSVESPGPKVPPLKIVIAGASLEETCSGGRNGKNGSGRHHLPYIVSTTPEASDGTVAPAQAAQPEESSGSTSAFNPEKPAERPGSGEEGNGNSGPAGSGAAAGASAGGRGHQRVLRSHRVKKGAGNGGKDSGSNNGGSGGSSPAGLGDAASPRLVSPTPGAEAQSEGEEKTATGGTGSCGGPRETAGGRESDAEKTATPPPPPQELHPRKRKIRSSAPNNGSSTSVPSSVTGSNGNPGGNGVSLSTSAQSGANTTDSGSEGSSVSGSIGTSAALESITNSYQLYLNIRKQIERKRKGLFPVQPKPPQGFKDYLMNRCTYVLANNANNRVPPPSNKPPQDLNPGIKDLYLAQEKERHRLLMQHVIEKEKLVLSVEQEILRVHGRAARALANQALPFSACTILRDEEVYSAITPEQEEKDRNARSRYNGRLFLSWLQDVDDKWEKIKEAMLLRHHNEAESLHAVQKMDWEWKMKELGICEIKSSPVIDDSHVPTVHVSDDFDLLPA